MLFFITHLPVTPHFSYYWRWVIRHTSFSSFCRTSSGLKVMHSFSTPDQLQDADSLVAITCKLQLGAFIMWSNTTWYCMQYYGDWGVCTHKRYPISQWGRAMGSLLWGFSKKWLLYNCTVPYCASHEVCIILAFRVSISLRYLLMVPAYFRNTWLPLGQLFHRASSTGVWVNTSPAFTINTHVTATKHRRGSSNIFYWLSSLSYQIVRLCHDWDGSIPHKAIYMIHRYILW